jgi:hypothetical protein
VQIGGQFEFDGFWWLPESDAGDPPQAQGRLSYDPERGAELAVIDLRLDPEDLFKPQKPISVLYGCNLQGKPCTLLDLAPDTIEVNQFGGHTREVLLSNCLIYGQHVKGIDELQVTNATVSVSGLREWVNHYWTPPGGGDDAAVPDLLGNDVYNVPLDGGSLLFQRGPAMLSGQLAARKSDAAVNVRFEFDKPLAYPEFRQRFADPLRDLVLLATHEACAVEAITVFVSSEKVVWWGVDRPDDCLESVSVVERPSPAWRKPRPDAFMFVPMPLRAWGAEAEQVIPRWFALRESLEGPGDLFFATVNKPHTDLEGDLLNLLSVAEGYHRVLWDEPPFPDEVHTKAVAAMLEAVEDDEQSQHYRRRLDFANQQSQRQRVRALFERAETVLGEAESWRRKQLQDLISTRNFLTHWGAPTSGVLEGWDLWFGLNRLRIVLEINFYLDLGIDLDTIEFAVRTANRHRAFLSSV